MALLLDGEDPNTLPPVTANVVCCSFCPSLTVVDGMEPGAWALMDCGHQFVICKKPGVWKRQTSPPYDEDDE